MPNKQTKTTTSIIHDIANCCNVHQLNTLGSPETYNGFHRVRACVADL